jgi:hypothetical protein
MRFLGVLFHSYTAASHALHRTVFVAESCVPALWGSEQARNNLAVRSEQVRVLREKRMQKVAAHGMDHYASNKTCFKHNPSENSRIAVALKMRWCKTV